MRHGQAPRRVVGLLLVVTILGLGGCGGGGTTSVALVEAPPELRERLSRFGVTPVYAGPARSPEISLLGQALFHDKILGGNKDISCGTCHLPGFGSGDGLPVSVGTGGVGLGAARVLGTGRRLIPRNAPPLFDRSSPQFESMFWDSRVNFYGSFLDSPAGAELPAELETVLDALVMFPVTSREEMRGEEGELAVDGQPNEIAEIPDEHFTEIWAALTRRLLAIDGYRTLFQAAYPSVPLESIGFQHAGLAMSSFIAGGFSLNESPFDRYVAGNSSALTARQAKGAMLFFGEAGCARCHNGPLLSDFDHHDAAVPQVGHGKDEESPEDFGRGRETGLVTDRYKFRTAPLRNVAVSGPWMHDGAFTTLEAAVRHMVSPALSLQNYDPSQLPSQFADTWLSDAAVQEAILANLDPLFRRPPDLTDDEVSDIAEFLHALTADSAGSLAGLTPASVPSGLPVDR